LVNAATNPAEARNPIRTALAITPVMTLPTQRLSLIPPARKHSGAE